MTSEEQSVYNLERQLIRKHFKGLRPRSVKIVKRADLMGEADEPYLLINKRLVGKKSIKDLRDTLKHELIHYELRDNGKDYSGHGQVFLKRATELGIIGSYELSRCFSLEEYGNIPTRRRPVQTPLKKVKEQINRAINGLEKLIMALPDKEKVKFYSKLQSLRGMWEVYSEAVEKGESSVSWEYLEKKRGPRGKSLEELRKEYAVLKPEYQKLFEELQSGKSADPKIHRKLIAIERKMDRISEKVENDYGSQLLN